MDCPGWHDRCHGHTIAAAGPTARAPTRAIERIWRGGIACDRRAFVASAAEAEQLDAFDAQLAKVVAAVRERWSN
jgi:hypothetical protein